MAHDAKVSNLVRDCENTLRTHIDEVAKQWQQKSGESLQLALATLQETIGRENSSLQALKQRLPEETAGLENTLSDVQEQLRQHMVAAGETNNADWEDCHPVSMLRFWERPRQLRSIYSKVQFVPNVQTTITRRSICEKDGGQV